MKSPFTGKEMAIRHKIEDHTYRGEIFKIINIAYYCDDIGESFLDTAQTDYLLIQVYNQYRRRHKIMFPCSIVAMRVKYEVSQLTMSKVLGIDIETYREYECMKVPTIPDARLVETAQDPNQFKKYVIKSDLSEAKKTRLIKHIDKLIE